MRRGVVLIIYPRRGVPSKLEDVTAESLELFTIVHPRPRIILLGVGRSRRFVPPEAFAALKADGVYVEVMDSMRAASWRAHC